MCGVAQTWPPSETKTLAKRRCSAREISLLDRADHRDSVVSARDSDADHESMGFTNRIYRNARV